MTVAASPSTSGEDAHSLIDDVMSPLLEIANQAVSARSRIPVLSLWKHIPFVALFASHLHLKWAGSVDALPLSPRIGIFPFFSSDLETLSRSHYHVQSAQAARQVARAKRFSTPNGRKGDLYPDWEQAVDRRRNKLGHLTLPAASFISVDRVSDTGSTKSGHRPVIGKFAPRRELKPQLLIPSRSEVTRQLVHAFDDLDLVLVNVQSIRGKKLARSIAYFLEEVAATVPMLIIASSPADLIATGALQAPSVKASVLWAKTPSPAVEVIPVNRDRVIVEQQFGFAIDGLAEKSDALFRLVAQAQRTWWATRQSISFDAPYEATAFETLYTDIVTRNPGNDLELLAEARRLILQESQNSACRQERRGAVIQAVFHDASAHTVLVLARSDAAARELKSALANYMEIGTEDLATFGIDVMSVFAPWPAKHYDACVAAGYFGTSTIDFLFASKAAKNVLVIDPIEARIAVWDTTKRFSEVSGLPEQVVQTLQSLGAKCEAHASPSVQPVGFSALFGQSGPSEPSTTMLRKYEGNASYVCVCFADGASRQAAANARFEVLGRKRLQLQSVPAKDLEVGDQVVLLRDDERAAFSEELLKVMDKGKLREDSQTRSTWITMVRAVREADALSATLLKQRLEQSGFAIDLATIRTWLPAAGSEECGVPEHEDAFLAFAASLGLVLPTATLKDWFAGIKRLRARHRHAGRELAKAIRGAYLGRLDAVTIARMEQEWGVQAKELLEAARVAVVDDVIPLSSGAL